MSVLKGTEGHSHLVRPCVSGRQINAHALGREQHIIPDILNHHQPWKNTYNEAPDKYV